MQDPPTNEKWIDRRLWLRWFRLWYGLLFLWGAGLAFNLGSWRWLLWPFLSFAAVLIFGAWLRRIEPKIGGSLAFFLGLLLFTHNVIGTWRPFLVARFPGVAQGLVRWQRGADAAIGANLACDGALQKSLGEYAIASQDADAAELKSEFDALAAAKRAGAFGAAEAAREQDLLRRYRQLIQRSDQLRRMLSESNCSVADPPPSLRPRTEDDSALSRPPDEDRSGPLRKLGGARIDSTQEFRALLNPVTLKPGERSVAIVLETSGAVTDVAPDQAMYGHLKPQRVRLVTDLFKQDLITRGYFGAMYRGDKQLVRLALESSRVDYFVLGRLNAQLRSGDPVDSELISCDLALSYKVLDRAGDVRYTNSFHVVGPGFSSSAAIERAAALLADRFSERVLKPIS